MWQEYSQRTIMKKIITVQDLIDSISEPSESIHLKIWNDVSGMLEFVEDGKSTPETENQIFYYCIIRTVSGIEVFLKSLLSELINEHDVDYDEIVEKSINFQNMENIDKIFSKLLPGASLFTILHNRSKEEIFGITIGQKKYNFDWALFNKLLTIRHELIHNMSSPKLTFEETRELFYCAVLFVGYIFSIIHDRIIKPKQDS